MTAISDVLEFWYRDTVRPYWFEKDVGFDRAVRFHLLAPHEEAAAGRLGGWRNDGDGCLALAILLDQAPRNMFRGTPRAFATDPLACEVARHAVGQGFDRDVDDGRRLFLYLPFEHSEDVEDQRLSVSLFRERTSDPSYIEYAERHLRIIERFGRFPHRNAILGRASTPEELEFLKQPGSSF